MPKNSTSPKKTRQLSSEELARQVAEYAFPSSAPNLDEALEFAPVAALFERLVKRINREYARDLPTLAETAATQERLQQALPPEMRKEFTQYCDSQTWSDNVNREATYLIGIAVGRRMAGVR